MLKEVFHPVKDFEGMYEVSTYGRIRSLARSISMGYAYKGTTEKADHFLKPCHIGYQHRVAFYKRDCFPKSKNNSHFEVGALVLSTFLFPRPQRNWVAWRIDREFNYHLDNLVWISRGDLLQINAEKRSASDIVRERLMEYDYDLSPWLAG